MHVDEYRLGRFRQRRRQLAARFYASVKDSVGVGEPGEVDVLWSQHDGLKMGWVRCRSDLKSFENSPAVVVADDDLDGTRQKRE